MELDPQKKALTTWVEEELKSLNHTQTFQLQAMAGDAGLRRYFRLSFKETQQSYVVMDASAASESCDGFVAIAEALKHLGLHTPDIISANLKQKYLILSDLGKTTYLQALDANNVEILYNIALKALSILQQCPQVNHWPIPPFTAAFMWQEWQWHKEWFLNHLLHLPLATTLEKNLDIVYADLIDAALTQPQVFMHRDFHSANLMVLPEQQVGILDFQDAFIGPLTYDLVSLLRDCYIDWPPQKVENWVIAYWQQICSLYPNTNQQQFLRYFDWMGVQRHLKALFTFARKSVRDGQTKYLQHIPRTLNYLITITKKYPELKLLHNYLCSDVKVAWEAKNLTCVQ